MGKITHYDKRTGEVFRKGLIPMPDEDYAKLSPFVPTPTPIPPYVAQVAKQLNIYGNSTYGDCVTAEEGANKCLWSVNGQQVYINPSVVIAWARKRNYLNGANLPPVMASMQKDGFVQDGNSYNDGPHQSVAFSVATTLQAAIAQCFSTGGGQIKIAIDADALPDTAGNEMGWYSLSTPRQMSIDHCVGISSYGSAEQLYAAMATVYPNVKIPAAIPPATMGYFLYTWATYGFVTQDWLVNCTSQAFIRNPGTVIVPIPNPGIMVPWPGADGSFSKKAVKQLKLRFPAINFANLMIALLQLEGAVTSGNEQAIETACCALAAALGITVQLTLAS